MRSVYLAAVLAALAGSAVMAQTSPPKPDPLIVKPDWLRKPTPEEMLAVWPTEAAHKGQSGLVVIACSVNITGLLQDCVVAKEDPPGSGFGQAALMLTGAFKMKPLMVAGKPVAGAVVRIPIKFTADGPFGLHDPVTQALSTPVWARAPSFADMEAAWPKKAGGVQEGGATLRCTVTVQGTLHRCEKLSELPLDKGFGGAAIRLVDRFQLDLTPEELKQAHKGVINVPFRFFNPASPEGQARKVVKPRWVVRIDPARLVALYPDPAADAGVRKGTGTANCLVAPDGRLTDCKVAREAPEALGFGPAGVSVASLMRMNPWTDDGRPVDGARIRLPITFTQAEEPAAKAKP